MKDLDRTKKYDLSQLNDKQLYTILDWLKVNDDDWGCFNIADLRRISGDYNLHCNKGLWYWINKKNCYEVTNALELFDNKLPPYKDAPLKWDCDTLVGDVIETKEHRIKELTKEILQPMGTLEQQLQKAEAEVKRLQSLIEEENKLKVGDWVIVKGTSTIFKVKATDIKYVDSRHEKITNPQLIILLEQEIK